MNSRVSRFKSGSAVTYVSAVSAEHVKHIGQLVYVQTAVDRHLHRRGISAVIFHVKSVDAKPLRRASAYLICTRLRQGTALVINGADKLLLGLEGKPAQIGKCP